ncbi:MAG: hypothetical protein R6V49_10830 [Bacteroidales bacterium]
MQPERRLQRMNPVWIILAVLACLSQPLLAQRAETWIDSAVVGRSISFKRLWPNQAYLNVALAGYREVSETDLFKIRSFNPLGPDMISKKSLEVNSRQSYYPLFTVGGSSHKILPLLTMEKIRLHFELSGDIFLQRILAPTVAENKVSDPSHYEVRYFNMPVITMGSISTGLWASERFSAGARYSWHRYSISTHDDRVTQIDVHHDSKGLVPWIGFWHPLSQSPWSRWSLKGTLDLPLFHRQKPDFLPASATLELFYLSTRHSGRVTGFFFKYLRYPEQSGFAENPDFMIHYDKQFLFGVNIGAGGWNRKGGR